MITAILSGLFSGIISGMGIGGGTILIPALTMFLKINQHTAQGVNLLFFIPTAVVALLIHKKNKNLEFKMALPLMLWGLLGASAGSLLAINLNQEVLRRIFGVFLFIMGGYEIYKGFKSKKS